MALLILLKEVLRIKTFYIRQGQNSIFRRIKIENNICTIQNLSEKTKIKKVEKTVKKLSKLDAKSVIISKPLHKNENFINTLKSYNITVFNGKWLVQYLIDDIIQCIEERKIKFKKDEISILANNLTEEVKGNIKELINKFKRIKIITNHSERFKKLEKDLYEQNGVPIIISNNKKKSLSKSEVIINFDFIEENINKYAINENAIIISLNEKIKVNTKRFNGIIITDYEVSFKNALYEINILIEDFYNKEICEEKIYNESLQRVQLSEANCSKFEVVRNIIKEYKITIECLYGKNGNLL
jgi:hypothetical protein